MCEKDNQGWQARVCGLVQGVGFRPTVWRLARAAGLKGEVLNDSEGVLIRVKGDRQALDALLSELRQSAPPLSRIDSAEVRPMPHPPDCVEFNIGGSEGGSVRTGIVPDAAICADCSGDIGDPENRRSGYAFTNCTNCGPRLSITRAIPYDRTNTSMDEFVMCAHCRREYQDPRDRRFHAQPNACPDCGPQLALVDNTGATIRGEPMVEAAHLLALGKIVAIKGLGGFHLACDATNAAAVDLLRERKRRPAKPFAIMGRDLAQVAAFAEVDAVAAAQLSSVAAPIVLLSSHASDRIARSVCARPKPSGVHAAQHAITSIAASLVGFPSGDDFRKLIGQSASNG